MLYKVEKSAADDSFHAFSSDFSKLLSLYSVEKENSEESQKLKRKESREFIEMKMWMFLLFSKCKKI
jgi:hypothetical protein